MIVATVTVLMFVYGNLNVCIYFAFVESLSFSSLSLTLKFNEEVNYTIRTSRRIVSRQYRPLNSRPSAGLDSLTL